MAKYTVKCEVSTDGGPVVLVPIVKSFDAPMDIQEARFKAGKHAEKAKTDHKGPSGPLVPCTIVWEISKDGAKFSRHTDEIQIPSDVGPPAVMGSILKAFGASH